MAAATETAPDSSLVPSNKTLLCTSLTANTVQGMLSEAQEALTAGADIVELRLDYLDQFNPETDLPALLNGCSLPAIVTYRPTWEGGKYDGNEARRLATLKYAATLDVAFIDVELKAANIFFSSKSPINSRTQVILSSHDYQGTASEQELLDLVQQCRNAGADIVKFATTAINITDAMTVLRVLRSSIKEGPVIALAMAEKGQITRILAPKYGGFLTFGALSAERQSAPGQPTLDQLREVYRLPRMNPRTKVFGIVGNPVKHSRSPAIHNASFESINEDAVFVPLLVDNMQEFLDAIPDTDWKGLCVTIPHKEAALAGSQQADHVAEAIGAANTLIRIESDIDMPSSAPLYNEKNENSNNNNFKAYNSDWIAAISAIERGLGDREEEEERMESRLRGKTVVVLGAGGAGRALAFGAATRGAKVIIANRSIDRACALASQLNATPPAQGVSLDDIASGKITGDILVNTTSVGMTPHESDTPIPDRKVLEKYSLVFDAVYTPLHTQLLKDAMESGCKIVTGDLMFVGQAAIQFEWFVGKKAPVELMRSIVLKSLST